MKLQVLLFAAAKELAGQDLLDITVPSGATVAEVRAFIVDAAPALAPLLSSLHIAVNSEYATAEQVVTESDEIACFPPVSGG